MIRALINAGAQTAAFARLIGFTRILCRCLSTRRIDGTEQASRRPWITPGTCTSGFATGRSCRTLRTCWASPRSWSEISAIQTVIHLDQGVNRLRGPFRMPKLRVLSAWIPAWCSPLKRVTVLGQPAA